ncbi:hypothetical protein GGR54DRAFT_644810 [Hypoxylon sp. NC1633]|nr:hypothetical protein GGR54DRAFT_644810 [Hypoxylon sp. NC1633]
MPGAAKCKQQRTKAIRHEIKNICHAVSLPVYPAESACVAALKKVLVNIVDYIGAMRMKRPVGVWTDFAAFQDYTLRDDKRFDSYEAKADGGFLAVLLRRLRGSHSGRGKWKQVGEAGAGRVKRERIN